MITPPAFWAPKSRPAYRFTNRLIGIIRAICKTPSVFEISFDRWSNPYASSTQDEKSNRLWNPSKLWPTIMIFGIARSTA
jgi:hypothetical protein